MRFRVQLVLSCVLLCCTVLHSSSSVLTTTVSSSISFRNITYSHEYCQDKDTAPGGIFAYNDTYVEKPPSQWRSLECTAFWADPLHSERANQKKLSIAGAKKLLQDEQYGSTLNAWRMKHVLKKISTPNETVHVYVFGGSETSGIYVHGYKGAWPAETEKMWNWYGENPKASRGLGANARFTNLAVGGTSSQWALHRLSSFISSSDPVDLVILEYDINDCAIIGDNDHAREKFMEWYELLLRRLLLLPNNVAVLYFNAAISHSSGKELQAHCWEYRQAYQMDALKKPLTEAYGIPMISQRDAIWGDFACPPTGKDWDCQKHSCAHPLWEGHQLMADIVHAFLSWGADTYVNTTARPSLATAILDATTPIWDAATDSKMVEQLRLQPFLVKNGAKQDAWICFDYAASVDRINSAFVAEKFEKNNGLEEGAAGAGIKIAKAVEDSHLKLLQKMHVHESQYQHVKLVQMDTQCWQYAEDVKGRADKMGWIISADKRPPPPETVESGEASVSADTEADTDTDANVVEQDENFQSEVGLVLDEGLGTMEAQSVQASRRRLRGGENRRKDRHHDHHKHQRQQQHRHLDETVDEATSSTTPSTCFGSFLTFQMKMGTRSQLSLSILATHDKHTGMGIVSIGPPLTAEQIEDNYIGPNSDFVEFGVLDPYNADTENGQGFSLVKPVVLEQDQHNSLHANETQNIRITFLDGNVEGFTYRERFEKRELREYPQRMKLVSVSTC